MERPFFEARIVEYLASFLDKSFGAHYGFVMLSDFMFKRCQGLACRSQSIFGINALGQRQL